MDCFGTYSTHAQRNKGAGNTSIDDSPQTIFHTGFLFLTFRHRLLRYSWYLDKSGSQRATVKVGDSLATVKVGGRLATVRLAG